MKKIAKKIWKFWALGIGTSLIISLSLVGLVWWALQPAAITQTATQTFIVPKGQSIKLIGQRLETAELIRHSWAFVLMVKWLETTSQVQAGSFQLSPSWSVARIVQELAQGTNDIWITLPEGWRREQIADYLANQPDLIAFDKTEFLALTEAKEGRLFPDTYLIPKQVTVQGLVAIFEATYQKRVIQGLEKSIATSARSLDEVIILASILEREAGDKLQMRQVAGVLENR